MSTLAQCEVCDDAPQQSSSSSREAEAAQKQQRIAAAFHTILRCIGEDPARPGLLDTPTRAAKAMLAATAGYALDPRDIARGALFSVDAGGPSPSASPLGMVFIRDIKINSLCEHHLLRASAACDRTASMPAHARRRAPPHDLLSARTIQRSEGSVACVCSVFRRGARCVHAGRGGAGALEARAHRRRARTPALHAGAPHRADRRCAHGGGTRARRGCRRRVLAHVYVCARRQADGRVHIDLGGARRPRHRCRGAPAAGERHDSHATSPHATNSHATNLALQPSRHSSPCFTVSPE
jgi:hypothetical protein